MKKVVITITNNISFDQRVIKIAQTLSTEYDVIILGANTRNPPLLEDLRDQFGHIVGFRPKRINTFFKSSFLFYAEFNFRLFWILLFMKVDFIYSVDLDTLLAGSLVSIVSKKKLLFDAHEYFTELPELDGKKVKKYIWERIGYFGIKQSMLNITVNKSLSDILSAKYKTNFHIIRNVPVLSPVSENPVNHTIDLEISKPYFIYQGATNQGRGIQELISMMNDFPDYQLVIAGSGPQLDKYKQQATANNNIIFTGNLPFYQLSELTKNAIIGFNLLESSSLNYYYSLANKFFDYTIAEIPSVNMNFPEYQLLNKEHEVGILIDNLDVEILVIKVTELINNTTKMEMLKKNCKLAKTDWNWNKEAELLIELFRHLPI